MNCECHFLKSLPWSLGYGNAIPKATVHGGYVTHLLSRQRAYRVNPSKLCNCVIWKGQIKMRVSKTAWYRKGWLFRQKDHLLSLERNLETGIVLQCCLVYLRKLHQYPLGLWKLRYWVSSIWFQFMIPVQTYQLFVWRKQHISLRKSSHVLTTKDHTFSQQFVNVMFSLLVQLCRPSFSNG